ncbi:hypothetical protein [Nodularia spumigena]|jgi:hypothetical protein|nr:hypothetical protein [Nodularia spumigena]
MFMSVTRLLNSSLWLKWTFITLLGFLMSSITGLMGGFLGFKILAYPLSWVLRGCEGQGAIGCIIIGAALGAAIGLGLAVGIAQWFILRSIVSRSQWWILASVLGWCGIFLTLIVMLYTAIPVPGSPEFGQPIIAQLPLAGRAIAQVTLAGALMGLFQWLILRSSVRQSWCWIPAHALIMLLAALGVLILGYNIGGLPGMGIFIMIFSPIYAVLSGSLLDWLVKHSRNPVTT